MPHLILEYSANISQEIQMHELGAALHQLLADTGGIRLENCKSRAVRREAYYIGQGETANAFVHLDIRFLEGRPLALKQEIGKRSLDILRTYFAPSLAELDLQITVQVQDIERHTFFKIPEASLP
jgi:5-carboxymethyl-2-hydroxymuconate isomerase